MQGDQFACIRIVGRANFTSSIDFKALVNELIRRGCHCFILDLSECVLMDSTFLGVLAGLGLKLSGDQGAQATRSITLLNANARVVELLETLGVLHLFKLEQGAVGLSPETPCVPQSPSNPEKVEITRTCLEAHQTLMDLNPQNVAKFKDATQFLVENLKRLTPPTP